MAIHLALMAFYFEESGPDQTVWQVQVRKLLVDADTVMAAQAQAKASAQDFVNTDGGGWSVDGREVTIRLGMVSAEAVDPSTLRPEAVAQLPDFAEEHSITGAETFAQWLAMGEVHPPTTGIVTRITRTMISVPARFAAVMAAAQARTEVSLWNMIGVSLIVLDPDGIRYGNQVDGNACRQAQAVGHLIPMNRPGCGWTRGDLERDLAHAFAGGWVRFTPLVARECQRILARHAETRGLSVIADSDDSCEAWLHVRIDADHSGALADFRGCTGMLTWANSD